MTMGLAFWIIMLVWFIWGAWTGYHAPAESRVSGIGYSLVIFILFLLLGWQVFGPPIRG
jgi:hypothetical protein